MADWYKLTTNDVLKALDAGTGGLSPSEARHRLDTHGFNELQEKGTRSPWRILLEQFAQTMVIILIVAALISGGIGDYLEAGAILAIVLLFAVLGFVQDYRADRAMAALREMAVPEVRVRRDGRDTEVSAKDLVPGDIVYLEAGNVVPADLRLMAANDLKVDEAALTGESEAVTKATAPIDREDLALGDRKNMAFSGTVVNSGRGKGTVVATGMGTEMGHIAAMIQAGETGRTPMQRELDSVGKMLAAGGIAVSIIVGMIGYFLLDLALKEMFLVAVSLAVAVVPEGLPAVVTLTLSLGSQRMLSRNALIRKLPAVETLGSVTTICTDKTGTLTQNRMTVTEVFVPEEGFDLSPLEEPRIPSLEDHAPEQFKTVPDRVLLLLAAGALCNDARLETNPESARIETKGDPTEGALRLAATRVGLSYPKLATQLPRTDELSFDSERKRMTTFHEPPQASADLPDGLEKLLGTGHGHLAITKGAADALLDISPSILTASGVQAMDDAAREKILSKNQALTRRGMRVLGLGIRFLDAAPGEVGVDAETDLVFVGLFGLIDPPRPEVKAAVDKCRTAGIRPIMITGDHPLTALNIAQELGITGNDHVLSGPEIDRMPERELAQAVKDTAVFARVSPEHKLRIVAALQRNGEICSMTGDGVNDAPALKNADIGVAMGITGTDVSKEAADMVLLDDNYATIVAAVEEGRVIGDNVRRFVKYSIAGNIGKVLVMMCAPLFGISLALLPLQLLWLNLITDGLLGLGMSVEPPEPNTMNRPPRRPDEGVFSRGGVQQVFIVGAVIGAVALGVGAWYYHHRGDHEWQTMLFTLIAFLQIGQALAMRSDRESFFALKLTGNALLLWVSLGILALQVAILYIPYSQTFFKTVPLTLTHLGVCAVFGTAAFFAVEIWKVYRRSRESRERHSMQQEQFEERHCRQLDGIERKLAEHERLLSDIKDQLEALAGQRADRTAERGGGDPSMGRSIGGDRAGKGP